MCGNHMRKAREDTPRAYREHRIYNKCVRMCGPSANGAFNIKTNVYITVVLVFSSSITLLIASNLHIFKFDPMSCFNCNHASITE